MYDTHKDEGELSDETVLNNILKETSLKNAKASLVMKIQIINDRHITVLKLPHVFLVYLLLPVPLGLLCVELP